MTSRRSIASWDARLSRALQFRAGHLSGRVDSAQPIRRNGGSLRRASVGAVEVPVYVGGYIGATGYLASGFDATYWETLYTQQVRTGDLLYSGHPVWSEVYETNQLVTLQDGDGMLVVAFADTGFTVTPPAGWTELGTGTNGRLTWYAYWAIRGAVSDYYFLRDPVRPSVQDPGIFLQMIGFRPEDGSGGVITPPSVDAVTYTGSVRAMRQGGTFTKQMTWLAVSIVAADPPGGCSSSPYDAADTYELPLNGNDLADLEVYYQYGAGHPLTGAQTWTFTAYPDGWSSTPDPTAQWVDLAIGWPL
jgi:hypothetical protein